MVENLLDLTLLNYLLFNLLDYFNPVKPVFNIIFSILSIPNDTTFDWSSGIDFIFLLLFKLDAFVIKIPLGDDNTASKYLADEQSLKEAILQLRYSIEVRLV